MSQIKVLFFGRLSDMVSEAETKVSIEQSLSAETLYAQLMDQNPSLPSREKDPSIKVAINQSIADWQSAINPGDEVAFLPPVTGG